MTFKVLIVLAILALIAKPLLKRRWPDLGRRINIALIAALIAVLLFRVVIWLRDT